MELFGKDIFGNSIKPATRSVLADEFIEPPFSVLNGRNQSRRWTLRKKAWLNRLSWSVADKSEIIKRYSVFDPVLCEIIYTWFCPSGGMILDPFAGGAIRGGVASALGYGYYGIELRKDLVEYNRSIDSRPTWVVGDALTTPMVEADFIFTCPPYGNYEVYSDDPRDLSTMTYTKFIDTYSSIILLSISKLRGEYAAIVVSNFREDGYYRNFVGDTITAFEKAGMRLYNDIIYLTPIGDAMMKAKKFFVSNKKVVKIHQNVLLFKKEV